MCVGLYQQKNLCIEHMHRRSCSRAFYVKYILSMLFCCLCSDVFHVCKAFGVAIQKIILWQNLSRSTS